MIYFAAVVVIVVLAGPFLLTAASVMFLLATAFIVNYWMYIIAVIVLFFGSIFLYAIFADVKWSDIKRSAPSDEDALPDDKSSDTTLWSLEERLAEDERREILGLPSLNQVESNPS